MLKGKMIKILLTIKKAQRVMLLCFFLSVNAVLKAQMTIDSSYFQYEKSWIMPIPTAVAPSNYDLPLAVAVDDKISAAYIFLNIEHKERKIHFLEVSTTSGDWKIHELPYSKKLKIDTRTNLGSIIIPPSSKVKHIQILIYDLLLVVDVDQDKIISTEKRDENESYTFSFEEYSIAGYYYDRALAKYKTSIAKSNNIQKTNEIHPSADFIQFTHFTPNRLMDCSSKNIAWLSVSKPMLFLYNHDLELEDSICFDTSRWVNVDHIKDLPKYRTLRDKGLFEFGTTILQDTASKNLSVQFVNDSLILVTSNYTTTFIQETLFSISKNNQLTVQSSRFANVDSLFSLQKSQENFEMFHQTASGNIQKNQLYFAMTGSGEMPWTKSGTEIDNEKYSYIHLHIFRFKD
jgi:hypothetical protein